MPSDSPCYIHVFSLFPVCVRHTLPGAARSWGNLPSRCQADWRSGDHHSAVRNWLIRSLVMTLFPASGRQPSDDLSLRPGLFRSLAHPAFQSIHVQSCQSLTSDGKVRPCFMMIIILRKYVSRWWPLCRPCWPAASWSAPRPWVRSSGSSTQGALTPRSSTSEP